jgi:hypothetical protein
MPHSKEAGVAILTSGKVDFKLKLLKRHKDGHFILIKGAIYQEEITNINLYATNFVKHTLRDLKPHIDLNTVVVGEFKIPILPVDRTYTQKINNSNKKS